VVDLKDWWIQILKAEQYPPDIYKEAKEQIEMIADNIEKAEKKALVRKVDYVVTGKLIDETELEMAYGDKKYVKLFVSEKPYGFDAMVDWSMILHYFDDYEDVDVEKREYIISFRVITENVKPRDLTIVSETQVSLFEWIHQPTYITIAEFLKDKTNELELLIGPELIIFHIPGFTEAYNPFGGSPLHTPNFFALRIVEVE